jgi:hypothetical protein
MGASVVDRARAWLREAVEARFDELAQSSAGSSA